MMKKMNQTKLPMVMNETIAKEIDMQSKHYSLQQALAKLFKNARKELPYLAKILKGMISK